MSLTLRDLEAQEGSMAAAFQRDATLRTPLTWWMRELHALAAPADSPFTSYTGVQMRTGTRTVYDAHVSHVRGVWLGRVAWRRGTCAWLAYVPADTDSGAGQGCPASARATHRTTHQG